MAETSPLVVVLMGVAGSGKSTVGEALSHALDWPFRDADSFHPPANVARMAAGIAKSGKPAGWTKQPPANACRARSRAYGSSPRSKR